MATKDYLEKLNKALPTCDDTIWPDANSLYELALQALKDDEVPPLGDDSTPTITVVTCSDLMYGGKWTWVEKKEGGWNSEAPYSDITRMAHAFSNQIGKKLKSTGTTETDSSESHVLAVWIPKDAEAEIHLGESNIPRSLHDIAVQMLLRKIKFSLLSKYFIRNGDGEMGDKESGGQDVDLTLEATLEKNVKGMLRSSESQFPLDETNKEAVIAHFTRNGKRMRKAKRRRERQRKRRRNDSSSDKECGTVQSVIVHVHPLDSIFDGISDSQLAELFNKLIHKDGRGGCTLCPNGDIEIETSEEDGKLFVDWKSMYCG